MPTVHTRYVTYNRKGGRRLHAGTATDDIVSPLSTATPDGGSYQAWASPSITWTDMQGEHTADFAFWWVLGAEGGPAVSTDPSLQVTVEGADVQAVAWYLPTGGGEGPGGPAYYIDAFDVNEGRFFDEDFVTISPDGALSAEANETGVVPTASAEDILAVASIEGVPFLDWTAFVHPKPQVLTTEDLKAPREATAVAFAFYQTPAAVVPRRPGHFELGTWVSWGVKVDGGGPTGRGPVEPWNPFVRQLAAGLALADAARLVAPELRGAVSELAARQVTLASEQIAGHIAGAELALVEEG
jgi:hypothetical protein